MPLLKRFLQQCQQHPDQPAMTEADISISYQQLLRRSQQLSHCFKPGQRVAIALDRGMDAAISILAVLQAGACYIPLDIKNPAQRLQFICQDADIHWIIGKGPCPDWWHQPQQWLDYEHLPQTTALKPAPAVSAQSLAAILYTSGSTGQPKGVALSHRAMLNFVDWAGRTFAVSAADRIASLAPFYFDLSVFDLFCSLSNGASIVFIPQALTLSPSRLTQWLQQQQISIWYTVPSILGFIALKGALAETPLPKLRLILFAGEVFPTRQLIKLCEQLPDTAFYNLYGPTETNVCCFWPVDRSRLHPDQSIPIGYPACDSELKIDADTGELFVKSQNNLSGYWQNGQLVSALDEAAFYATGDKVSRNEQGEYCYHGRLDRMLKCSGFRVEPAEIEQAICQHPSVSECAVVGIKDSTAGQRPAAAVVLKQPGKLADIIQPVKTRLPAYMQPCKFIVLDELPRLANGKTDYQHISKLIEQT